MRRAKALLTPLILAAGGATFLYLLWTFGPSRVWNRLLDFGWGFAAVLPFQILDHMINALGWRFALPAAQAGRAPFWDLVRVRVAGDGVNYLTPSGNVAGEFVRPGMMRSDLPDDVKITSVLAAKAAQALGQAFFVLLGLAYILQGRLYAFHGRQIAVGVGMMTFIIAGVALGVWLAAHEPPAWARGLIPDLETALAPVRSRLKGYLKRHPGRMAASILCFMAGYAWGAAEVWLICRLMGLELSAQTALAIEFLSNLVDAVAFMVPAKIGTQEAGKTVIFAGLGLAPEAGFTMGLIRHAREVIWAGAGLAIFAAHQRKNARP